MDQGARSSLPVVTISGRGADRIRAGHVWVYRSDVLDASGVERGAAVLVQERVDASAVRTRRGLLGKNVRARNLGTALYSTASEIAIRLLSPKAVEDVEQLVRERIRAAVAYRARFVRDTNAYRVIFSEGDFLPGLVVDKYNDVLSLQVLAQAMDAERMRKVFLSELADALAPAAIVERVDPRVRKLEQLPDRQSGIAWNNSNRTVRPIPDLTLGERGMGGETPVPPHIQTEFEMNGVRFIYDALSGQKTGAFLDQRENYAAAEKYARGQALDVFTYQGGFALHLARVCDKVTGVDSSRPALEAADQNAVLNERDIEWIEANAFDLLRDYSDAGRAYDTIVLDPPPFAKSRQNLVTAIRGYKELNLRALKMLRPGGVLITCSCSYHVSTADLIEVVSSAARDSHKIVRILENRGQSKDHPSVLGIPETAYLKCLIAVAS
jgi:23S rRNA (cytosine1962-C5)-methyltransferase